MSNWKWIDQENKDHIALWAVSVVAIREVSAVLTIRLPVRYYWVRFSSQADLKEFANWLSYLTLLCAFLIFGESVSEHLNRKISCLHKSNRQQEIIAGSPQLFFHFRLPGHVGALKSPKREHNCSICSGVCRPFCQQSVVCLVSCNTGVRRNPLLNNSVGDGQFI